jgi:hypothetical protein
VSRLRRCLGLRIHRHPGLRGGLRERTPRRTAHLLRELVYLLLIDSIRILQIRYLLRLQRARLLLCKYIQLGHDAFHVLMQCFYFAFYFTYRGFKWAIRRRIISFPLTLIIMCMARFSIWI